MFGLGGLRQHAERIADTTEAAAGDLVPVLTLAALAVTAVALAALMIATVALVGRYPDV